MRQKKKKLEQFLFCPQCRKCSAVKINSMTDAAEHPEESKEKKSCLCKRGDIMPSKRLHFSCQVACQPGILQSDNAGAVTEGEKA